LSAGLCGPGFACFSAGVAVGGWSGFVESVSSPAALGILLGLVVGKCLGITGATWLVTRLRGPRLDPTIAWPDVVGVSLVAGIGFRVSLLITVRSSTDDPCLDGAGKVGMLTGSA